MSVYVVRHGLTDWNKKSLIQGRIDIPLNEEGIEQARQTKEKLAGVHLDLVFCSPLLRAKQTAEIIVSGRDIPTIIEPRIQEEYYGELEGEPRSGEPYLSQKRSFFKRYPGGEGYLDVAGRVYPFLDEVKASHKEKDILLVCHGGMSRIVNSYFLDMSNEEFMEFGLDNCEVRKYEFRD